MKNFLKIFVFSAMRMPLVNITMKRTGDTTAVTHAVGVPNATSES